MKNGFAIFSWVVVGSKGCMWAVVSTMWVIIVSVWDFTNVLGTVVGVMWDFVSSGWFITVAMEAVAGTG